MKKNPFSQASVIITGGASGIGRALALEMARRGAMIVIADRQLSLAEAVVEEITSLGGQAWSRELDVRDFSTLENIVNELVNKTGRLDYMINNAGIGLGGLAEDLQLADWQEVLDVNLQGVINGIQASYKVMISQGFGHIVNTASIAGLIPTPGSVAYSASKFAVAGLSQALRVEAGLYGVKVSVLCPGAVKTEILKGGKFGKLPQGMNSNEAEEYWEKFRPQRAENFAPIAVDLIAKNKAIIIVPRWWSLFYWLYRFSWGLWYRESRKGFIKTKKILKESRN